MHDCELCPYAPNRLRSREAGATGGTEIAGRGTRRAAAPPPVPLDGDSAGLGAVVDECSAGAAELVVEGDRGGEAEEALKDALSKAWQGSGRGAQG